MRDPQVPAPTQKEAVEALIYVLAEVGTAGVEIEVRPPGLSGRDARRSGPEALTSSSSAGVDGAVLGAHARARSASSVQHDGAGARSVMTEPLGNSHDARRPREGRFVEPTPRRWSHADDAADSVPRARLDGAETRRIFDAWGLVPMLAPAANVYETADELVVELEVPGFDEKDLDVEVIDHVLTIKGTRKETREQEDRTFRLHKQLDREFLRRFELPARGGHDEGEGRVHEGRAGAPHAEDGRGEASPDPDRGQVSPAGCAAPPQSRRRAGAPARPYASASAASHAHSRRNRESAGFAS